jgi:hypothetical protein
MLSITPQLKKCCTSESIGSILADRHLTQLLEWTDGFCDDVLDKAFLLIRVVLEETEGDELGNKSAGEEQVE